MDGHGPEASWMGVPGLDTGAVPKGLLWEWLTGLVLLEGADGPLGLEVELDGRALDVDETPIGLEGVG